MGVGERTPLRGSEDHVPYVFMTNPNRAYKKKVRLLQCYLCSAVLIKVGASPFGGPCEVDGTREYECSPQVYRSPNGVCNNLNHPLTWGVSIRPFTHLLPAEYCDGFSSPRCALSKSELPSSLSISSKISNLNKDKIRENNIIRMLWGHFVYQDLVFFHPSKSSEENKCCGGTAQGTECYPIVDQRKESLQPMENQTCLPYVRTHAVTCSSGKRMQLNTATSFLDGSVIYGSTVEIEKRLRKFMNGELVLFISPENKYLPINMSGGTECGILKSEGSRHCSNEAFSCISESLSLPTINRMLAKHHNFIASQLEIINPHWDDEKLYQTARKIVTAQIQQITYNEFLESTIGSDLIKTFGDNSETGYFEEYDASVDPTIEDAFPIAFQLIDSFLPESSKAPEGKELQSCTSLRMAYRIQRARDHGIPGYTKWREHCRLGTTSNFQDLAQALGADAANALQELYQNVEDIDLPVGLLAEMPESGQMLGPVGACIIADQFKRTKTGDRFWFETSQSPQHFNAGQLAEIHKTTLSRIICDHSENLKMIEFNSLRSRDDNPTMSCSALPTVNLSLWEELRSEPHPNLIPESSGSQVYSSDSIRQFMNSGNDFILKSSKGSAKSDITKRSTSFTVNILNATLKIGDEVIDEVDSGKPPYKIPLDSIADTSAYNPTASVTFTASYQDDILQGNISLPVKNTETLQITKKILNLSFIAGISIKWGGSLELDSNRNYKCKLTFQSYSKLSTTDFKQMTRESSEPLQLRAGESDEQCNIFMIGTYYHRPFYCPLTPWWCMEGLIFYWSGDAKLIFIKPAPTTPNSLSTSGKLVGSSSSYMLGKTGNEVIEKTFASVTVINGRITGQFNGEEAMPLLDGSPPINVALDNFINPNSFDTSLTATWSATPIDDRTIVGQFSVPYFPTVGSENIERRKFSANFTVDVIYKYGGSIAIIDPSKTYSCKVMFQANKKSSLKQNLQLPSNEESVVTIKGKTPFGESCSITISGTFYEPSAVCKTTPDWCNKEKIFHWSGDIELALKYKYNKTAEINDIAVKKLMLPNKEPESSALQLNKQINTNFNLGKTGDEVTTKTFASVTVIRGKISGQFNGEEAMEVMNGSPPIDIYLDNFVNPNSFDTSVVATWSAKPVEDSVVVGTFSLPYFPSIDNYSERRKFTANFSVDIIYKYGGSIGIIDPTKTYSCKVMFQGNKKMSLNSAQSIDPSVPLKGKTPFGESCSITVSGAFYEPSVFCYITPWWCSKEKIFHWYGDIELALKYKYNSSNPDNSVKKLGSQVAMPIQDDVLQPTKAVPKEDYFCCGHRFGGQVSSGWIEVKTGGLFSTKKTIWSGEIPFEIQLPVFWTPSNDDGAELSSVYGHAILWSGSIFHSTIQGSFSFPQYVGHGPPPSLKWVDGKFSFQLAPNPYVSLYDLVVPGLQYQSNLYFHNKNSPVDLSFVHPKIRDPSQEAVSSGIRAPIILLGKYSPDKQFIWNGTFVIDFSKTAKDLYYG